MLDLRIVQSHKRPKSFPEKKRDQSSSNTTLDASQRIKLEMGRSKESTRGAKHNHYHSNTETSLKLEVDQLETRLEDQFKVRCALEKALGYGTASSYMLTETNDIPISKQATDLIKEIAVLEMEVIHLEHYLLSLYRKAFDQPNIENKKPTSPPSVTAPTRPLDFCDESSTTDPPKRCSAFETKKASPEYSWSESIRSSHSQPMHVHKGENLISLAEHLGTRISDHVPETPNKLSEGMVKCMSEIYCKLSEPPPSVLNHRLSPSPNSSLSSSSALSPSGLGNSSSFDNSFRVVEGEKDFSGPYINMIEVLCIHRDAKKASEVEDLLQNFKSLISRLEEVDPSKLKHEEKVAFWINVHNALVMHAYLAYGIPQNNVKRVLLLLKAVYNVGGHTVSAEAIQSSILGCKMSHPGVQWLRLLFASKKFKAGDERIAYAIDHPEPLLHFALTSGSHSDPPVRVYTPKRIQQELETSKEDYIRMNFSIRNQKVQLPSLVETFAKESGLCPAGVTEMVNRSIPESSRQCLRRCQAGSKSRKAIDWIPHSFTFRYLIFREAPK